MRKLVALVVVLTMVLSSMSMAFAAAPFSDVSGNKYESSVNKLYTLGILKGNPDGTFKPDSNITRAEFAAILDRALGLEEAAAGASASAIFSDTTGHWAAGYINIAAGRKIVNGVGGGKFAPDANVTYEQAVTMVVRALGYEVMAASKGGYPLGYLSIASEKKLLDGIKDGVAGVPATRALIAKVIDNALDKNWLVQEGFGANTIFKESDKTIYSEGLGLDKGYATVKDVNATKKTVDLNVTKPATGGYTVDANAKKTYTVADGVDYATLKNQVVAFYTKNDIVYYIDNKTTVYFDKIKEVNGSDSTANTATDINKIKLAKADTSFDVDYSSGNGLSITSLVSDAKNYTTSNAGHLVKAYAKVYVKDSKIYRVEPFTFDYSGIVTSVDGKKLVYQKYDKNDASITDLDSATDLTYVFIDGVQKSLADLKADMYFEGWQKSDNKEVVIAATTAQATGKLDSYKSDKITVAGTGYDLTDTIDVLSALKDSYDPGTSVTGSKKYVSLDGGKNYDKYSVDDLVGKDVVAYLDTVGKVAFVKGASASSTSDFYGIVTRAYVADSDMLKVVRDVDGKSTEVTYALDLDDYDAVNNPIDYSDISLAMGASDAKKQAGLLLFKFSINSDNKIKKIKSVLFDNAAFHSAANIATIEGLGADSDALAYTTTQVKEFNDSTGNIKANSGSGDRYYYGKDAHWFRTVKDDGTAGYEAKVIYWNDLKGKDTGSIALALNTPSGKDTPDVAVITAGYATISSSDRFFGLVTSSVKTGDDYEVTVATNSGNVKVVVDADDMLGYKGNLEKAIIEYSKDSDTRIKVKSVFHAAYDNNNYIVWNANNRFLGAAGGLNVSTSKASQVAVDTSVNDIDGSYIRLDNPGSYVRATDAVVVKISGDDRYMSNLSDIRDEDYGVGNGYAVATIVDDKGVIKGIFYVKK